MGSRLGQHFLVNSGAVKKIIEALTLKRGDALVEIGAGRGALTNPLARICVEVGCKITAIEKDASLVKDLTGVEVIIGDALKIVSKAGNQRWKLTGNIPYYITGRLLRILSELENKPKLVVLTLQKEVAERIVAEPPKMNLLAAITQFWSEPKIIASLKPDDFSPPPKVDSAIIKLTTRDWPLVISAENYYRFVKVLFKQPRKTVFNNLRSGLKINPEKIKNALESSGLTGDERPQNLSLKVLISLGQKNLIQ